MPKIILQPAGDADATIHYVDTIVHAVELERIRHYVTTEIFQKLQNLYPNNKVPIWGVTRGKNDVNKNKWEKVESGDIALFARENEIFASATVAFTLHNKELAEELWKTNTEGETWEYIYFLDEVIHQQIPYEKFDRAVGYDEKYIVRGFNVLDYEKSQRALALLGLESETYYPEISKEEYIKSVTTLNEDIPLDKISTLKARTEQAFLRSFLFNGKKIDKCGICERVFPVNFLVAAHIKKRAECTDEEKRDFKNIVIPMCKFGCDELYEKGFFGVSEGKIIVNRNKFSTKSIEIFLGAIENRSCPYWNDSTKKYFEWHFNLHKNEY